MLTSLILIILLLGYVDYNDAIDHEYGKADIPTPSSAKRSPGEAPGAHYRYYTNGSLNWPVWLITERTGTVFRVKAAEEAKITLLLTPHDPTSAVCDIILGTDSNIQSVVFSYKDRKNVATQLTTAILSDKEYRPFWIQWKDRQLKVGRGEIMGIEIFLTWYMGTVGDITALSVDSGSQIDAFWSIPWDSVRVFQGSTNPNPKIPLWVGDHGPHSLVFRVQACMDAQLFIATQPDDQHTAFEIRLGSKLNQESYISHLAKKKNVTTETPDILDCLNLRYFWILWLGYHVEVGRGAVVGEQTFISYRDTSIDSTKILHIGFATKDQKPALWEMRQVSDNTYTVFSAVSAGQPAKKLMPAQHFFQFQVRACESAILTLTNSLKATSSTPAFIVFIGHMSNQVTSIIRRLDDKRENVTSAYTPGILDCDSMRPFWLKWKDQHLQVGKGTTLDNHILVSWKDTRTRYIQTIALDTEQPPGKGIVEWRFPKSAGKLVDLNATQDMRFDQMWISLASQTYVTFKVSAYSDATIALSEFFGVTKTRAYQVIIGAAGNTKTSLWTSDNGTVWESDTEYVLDPYVQAPFWIRWAGGLIEVGIGLLPGELPLISWKDPSPSNINMLSVTTPKGILGHWTFLEPKDDTIIYKTYTVDAHQTDLWMSIAHNMFIFEVTSCENATLVLTEVAEVIDKQSYTLQIGVGDFTQEVVIINKATGAPDETFRAHTAQSLLDCLESKSFWIKWTNISVTFGRGQPLTNTIFSWLPKKPHAVNFISIPKGTLGLPLWAIPRWQIQVFKFRSKPNDMDFPLEQLVVTNSKRKAVRFKVLGNHDAVVHMSPKASFGLDSSTVILGTKDNKESILYARKDVVADRAATPGILSNKEWRWFWIQWTDESISVGKGPEVGKQRILYWGNSTQITIDAVSFECNREATVEWEVTEYEDDVFVHKSSGDLGYGIGSLRPKYDFVIFNLQTAGPAIIDLVGPRYYQIRLGVNNNTMTILAKDESIVQEQYTPELLRNGEKRRFWVTWRDGNIRFGRGELYSAVLLDWDDPDTSVPDISRVSLYTFDGSPGLWEIKRAPGDVFEMITPDGHDYSKAWITTSSQDFMVFSVMSEGEASLALTEFPGIPVSEAYEIQIGSGKPENQMSYIRRGVGGQIVASASTPYVLDGDNLRTLWISWAGGKVRVGKGSAVGDLQFMEWQDPTPLDSNAVSFTTNSSESAVGIWQFGLMTGTSTLTLYSPAAISLFRNIWLTAPDVLHITFWVQACQDARLLLIQDPENLFDNFTEVRIGINNNQDQEIVSFSREVDDAVRKLPGLLSCFSMRQFWVSWEYKVVSFGRQTLGFGKVLDLGIRHEINMITFATFNKTDGIWMMERPRDDPFTLYTMTSALGDYRNIAFGVEDRNTLVFKIRACRNAHVSLASLLNNPNSEAREFCIGCGNNMVSYMKEDIQNVASESIPTPNILNCDTYRTFWVYWTQNMIRVGSGGKVGRNKIMESSTYSTTRKIREVFVATPGASIGEWLFSKLGGKVYNLFTPSKPGDDNIWVTPKETGLIFRVRTKQDLRIGLSEDGKSSAYEVNIGTYKNTKSCIKNSRLKVAVEKNTADILSQANMRSFWVGWKNNMIEVGKGPYLYHNRFMHWKPKGKMRRIKYISLSSTKVDGFYEIPSNAVQEILSPTRNFGHGRVQSAVMDKTFITFSVQAPKDIAIALSVAPGVFGVKAFEVVLGKDNQKSSIRKLQTGEIVATEKTSKILDPSKLKDFWIGWRLGMIQVGTGLFPYIDTFMKYTGSDVCEFNAVSLTSMSNVKATWKLPEQETGTVTTRVPASTPIPPPPPTDKDIYVLNTSGGEARDTYYVVTDADYTVFSVMACSDVIITLADIPDFSTGSKDPKYIEIILDTEDNTAAYIKPPTGMGDTVYANTTNKDVLSCNNSRIFWMDWTGDLIVGMGLVLGKNRLIQWAKPKDLPIHGVAYSTATGIRGSWLINRKAGRTFNAKTPAFSGYTHLWSTSYFSESLVVGVQFCKDVRILLAQQLERADYGYEIVINKNGKPVSEIRDTPGGVAKATAATRGILSCKEMRYIWVKWYRGEIAVGRGMEVGQNQFLFWRDPTPKIAKHYAVAANGTKAGVWSFPHHPGTVFLLKTPKQDLPKTNFALKEDFFIFRVRACSDALIRLPVAPEGKETIFYHIILGAFLNTMSRILLVKESSKEMIAVPTPYILSCEAFKDFWITNEDGRITVGRGRILYESVFMTWNSSWVKHTEGAMVATPGGMGEWEYKKDMGTVAVEFTTDGSPQYGNQWMTTGGMTSVTFTVMACENVQVALAQYLGVTKKKAYEVLIGIEKNTESAIKKSVGGEVAIKRPTSPILNCYLPFAFWINWESAVIQVGSGTKVGYEMFMRWEIEDSLIHPINAITFLTNDTKGLWTFGNPFGDVYAVETPMIPEIGNKFLTPWFVTHKNHFVFRVAAEYDARIVLATVPGNATTAAAEIIIGAHGNSKSVIRINGKEREVPTPEILSWLFLKDFWVAWVNNGSVGLGIGAYGPTQTPLLTMPMTFQITAVSVTTDDGDGFRGNWLIPQNTGTVTYVRTHYDQDAFWMSAAGRTSFVFGVQACYGAHLELSRGYQAAEANVYDIVIGNFNNTRTMIRRLAPIGGGKEKTTPWVLDCNTMLTFWIGWENGLVEVGRGGTVGGNLILSYRNPEPSDINSIALYTETDGEWEFSQVKADSFVVTSKPAVDDPRYNVMKLHTRSTQFAFRVQSCKSAIVGLFALSDQNPIVEIQIGYQNKYSRICDKRTIPYKVVSEAKTPGILSCTESRPFWVTWEQAIVRVGQGELGQNMILEWQPKNKTLPIARVGIATSEGSIGEWEVSEQGGDALTVYSGDNNDNTPFWVGVPNSDYMLFGILACKNALINLSKYPGVNSILTYQIELGVDNKTRIRNSPGGKIMKELSTPDILDCAKPRYFWVTWTKGHVVVGRGTEVGTFRLLDWQDPQPQGVSSVSFNTMKGTNGRWELSRRTGDSYRVQTPKGYNYTHIWWIPEQDVAELTVETNGEVRILLAQTLGRVAKDDYEIVLCEGGDKMSAIYRGNIQLVVKDTEYLCSISAAIPLWIVYRNKEIQVGHGKLFSGTLLMVGKDLDPAPVRAVSVCSMSYIFDAIWEIPQTYTRAMTVVTPYRIDPFLDMFNIQVSDRKNFVFQVKACESVRLRLFIQGEAATSLAVGWVFLGIDGNTASSVAAGLAEEEVKTYNVLNCNEFRAFWVSWASRELAVGRGPDPLQGRIISIDLPQHEFVNSIALGKVARDSATWMIGSMGGNTFSFKTTEATSVDKVIMASNNNSTFRVQACNSAHVSFLSAIDPNTLAFKLQIGDNSNSKTFLTSNDGSVLKEVNTPNILSCKQFRSFWVTWNSQSFAVGYGSTFQHPFLYVPYAASPNKVKGIGFSSGSAAFWDLERRKGQELWLKTTGDNDYDDAWIHVVGRVSMVIRVKLDRDANIALSAVFRDAYSMKYEIALGMMYNSVSVIRKDFTEVGRSNGQELSSTEYKTFWVSWGGGVIQVGRGETVGVDRFLSYEDADPYPVNALGVTSGKGTTGYWYLAKSEGDPPIPTEPPPTTASVTTTSSKRTTIASSTQTTKGPKTTAIPRPSSTQKTKGPTTTTVSRPSTSPVRITTAPKTRIPTTPSTVRPTPPTTPAPGGLSEGAKVGIAFGVVAGVLIIFIAVMACLRRRDASLPVPNFIKANDRQQLICNPLYDTELQENITQFEPADINRQEPRFMDISPN